VATGTPSARDVEELAPEIAKHVRRRVLALAWMAPVDGAARALRFHVTAHVTGRHREHEAAGRVAKQRFGGVIARARQLGQTVADQRRLADEHVGRRRMSLGPFGDGAAPPNAHGAADDRLGDAVHDGMATSRGRRFEDRARHIPLQQVRRAAGGGGEMRELVNQQALAGARQPRDDHHPRVARERDEAVVAGRGGRHQPKKKRKAPGPPTGEARY
jgi:hypothetical protein